MGPQVKRLMKYGSFSKKLPAVERRAWKSFAPAADGLLGNHKADSFREIVEELVDAYEKVGCRMSLKLNVLHSHVDELKDNMDNHSEEQDVSPRCQIV